MRPAIALAAASGLAAVATTALDVAPVIRAFPKLDSGCTQGVQAFQYWWTGAWTAAEQSLVVAGFNQWDSYRGRSGIKFTTSTPPGIDPRPTTFGSGRIEIVRSTTLNDNNTSCAKDRITLDVTDPALRYLAAHEAGHMFDMNHSGNEDSHPYSGSVSTPLMSGCTRPNPVTWVTRNDDLAQLSNSWDSGAQSSDMGFENSIGAWFGAPVRTSGNAYTGSWKVPVGQGETIESRPVRVTTPGNTQRMAVRFRSAAGANRIKFKYRAVDYGATDCNPGQMNPAFDWDDATFSTAPNAWVMQGNVQMPVSPSGTWVTSNTIVPPPILPNGQSWNRFEGIDIQVSYWAEGSTATIDELVAYA
jgi:hypothetical protein